MSLPWFSRVFKRQAQPPYYALPALTTLFERHGFKYAGFSHVRALTDSERHYFVRRDCSYEIEFGIGQHTIGDRFVAVGASHPNGPRKTKFAPLSYFVDYHTTLNHLQASGVNVDEALAASVGPHIEYAARVAVLAHSRGRSIPLKADLQECVGVQSRVEP